MEKQFNNKSFSVDPWGVIDKTLCESDSFKAIACACAKTEGHLLVVPTKRKIVAMAELSEKEYKELTDFENHVASKLSKFYGGEIIIGEHGAGSNPLFRKGASNSIFEAHRHIAVLGNKVTVNDISEESEMKSISKWEDFSKHFEKPYIFMNNKLTTKNMGRQYFPRKIAESFGLDYTIWQEADTKLINLYKSNKSKMEKIFGV